MYQQLIQDVWPNWEAKETIGEGTYGIVYKVVNRIDGANGIIKVISLPRSETELAMIKSKFSSDEEVKNFFSRTIEEFNMKMMEMEPYGYDPNLVRVEDYTIKEREGEPGYYILLRMGDLDNLNIYQSRTVMREKDVIRLGIDVCKGLEVLERCGIVHGNLKPENVFVTSVNHYQVGDALLCQAMSFSQTVMSKKKLPGFLAPEVRKEKDYDIRADIYSLGLIMYRAMNKNHLPFQDPDAVNLTYAQKKEAQDRRFAGEYIPAPLEASTELATIILKACAFEPSMRFPSPTMMREKLERLLNGEYDYMEDVMPEPIVEEEPVEEAPVELPAEELAFDDIPTEQFPNEVPQAVFEPETERTMENEIVLAENKKNSKRILILLIIILILAMCALIILLFRLNDLEGQINSETAMRTVMDYVATV